MWAWCSTLFFVTGTATRSDVADGVSIIYAATVTISAPEKKKIVILMVCRYDEAPQRIIYQAA